MCLCSVRGLQITQVHNYDIVETSAALYNYTWLILQLYLKEVSGVVMANSEWFGEKHRVRFCSFLQAGINKPQTCWLSFLKLYMIKKNIELCC